MHVAHIFLVNSK